MLWNKFKSLILCENLRLTNTDNDLKNFLLKIGEERDLSKFEMENHVIHIPAELLSHGDIITESFGKYINYRENTFRNKAILVPTNEDALRLNNEILNRIEAENKIYLSIDTIKKDENEDIYIIPFQ